MNQDIHTPNLVPCRGDERINKDEPRRMADGLNEKGVDGVVRGVMGQTQSTAGRTPR
jgi:hypothetical protein